MINKPKNWQTTRGPFKSTQDLQITKNIETTILDWGRIHHTTIDGKNVRDIINQDLFKNINQNNYSANTAILKDFFKNHLLHKLPQDKQDEGVDYAIKTLHQYGLLGYLGLYIFNKLAEKNCFLNGDGNNDIRKTDFYPTENGFKIQSSLTIIRSAGITQNDDNPPTPLLKCTTIIDVDFIHKDQNHNPTLTLESSAISYHNKTIQNILDDRNFFAQLIDWIKKQLGWNTVEIKNTP